MADIILVEDHDVLRQSLVKTLIREGHQLRTAETAEEAIELISAGPPDLLVTDHRLPGMTGRDLLSYVAHDHPEVGVLLITTHGSVGDAVLTMRGGPLDYIEKPIDLAELKFVVSRCLERSGLRLELDYYRKRDLHLDPTDGIIGSSPNMEKLHGLIARLASREKRDSGGPPILLTGETGTGKGLAARALHKASSRAGKPFIEVNCSAIPENLLEAELMGYERGGSTDAAHAKAGLFEIADGGTIFFDEIGHIPVRLEAKLLKVIEDRCTRRAGSTRDRPVTCTIMTATHLNLDEKVERSEFVEDLLHGIDAVRVELPPLRERGNDRFDLAEYFVIQHASDYDVKPPILGDDARAAISAYHWPGNVRELSHAIERAIVHGVGEEIHGADLALGDDSTARVAVRQEGRVDVDFAAGAIDLENIETDLIRRAMLFTDGNRARAARMLGITRDALRYRLRKLGSA